MQISIGRAQAGPSILARREHKAALGQFMTSPAIARYMASLFPASSVEVCRLLDPGAGAGALSSAFLDRWAADGFEFRRVELEAYEIDPEMLGPLEGALRPYAGRLSVNPRIVPGDFIGHAVGMIMRGDDGFTHAILNPPYKKIGTASDVRWELRQAGIETVNLYSAFFALALALLQPGGHLVAIVPRSFCNGPYYRPFRAFVLERAAIRQIHLFGARDKAFAEDGVLQENVIVHVERGGQQGDVTVSTSSDDRFDDYTTNAYPFGQIVLDGDSERFIHVPASQANRLLDPSMGGTHTLKELGLTVSTGPVVDFRLRDHLRLMPTDGSVPLLYPAHFTGGVLGWPKGDIKKPNAILRNSETERWLYPTGFYTVIRRFSSKEERRRIIANVVDPAAFGGAAALGFENHLNVFHRGKRGLPEKLARGLAVYLSCTVVDEHFRRFSGHTQVNATDLRNLRYPSSDALLALGEWATWQAALTQGKIDERVSLLAA